ncbi:kynureninase [Alkalihalobacillus alcalophilus ATCC 27647 = CGMCC 1.3604]|uniref:Kynureninase n=1 Tax=Alkalihalobacillus alcalophilus ATCC 27647 = CGMCC 1.3604 TaxID=1218173 RepID=A0A094YSB2_ALKAL|nr:kynureninase [Alkalihalobacillus alcalophilus]KGA96372.1 kynureninase [Alkalihalobacillus alcalophilus ATCC 27647 = CGMCC 1.3604]MED1563489.1 kynureninase [Alkalihalobacillus alcalophilus]THG90610.1 kynureninase [Alkalihalobacillus alcalophilus ATCC 27647 = CGMCC 1.3604]
MTRQLTYETAIALDKQDSLASFREEFYLQDNQIYLDGNSLGLLSKRAEKTLHTLIDSWKTLGIDGWTEGNYPWFYLSESLGDKMAQLVGAFEDEVIVTGSTTTNLHQLVATFYKPAGKRTKILADELNFPSDIYALQSQIQQKGFDYQEHLVQVKSADGHTLKEEDIIEAMTDEIALILLPSVLYRSGQILDMKRLTEEARQRGIVIGFDLCHSIGSIPHELSEWGVDFAFWCTYKHLNGGPGSVGSLYVNRKHFGTAPGLAGWFSSKKEKQFDMEHTLTHAEDAGAFQMGTPHVLSLAPLIGSLELFHEAGIEQIRQKSLALTRFMKELMEQELKGEQFVFRNPDQDDRRGGHLYIEHPEAARICRALKDEGVIPDFRTPNGIRLAPVALYNSFEDVWNSVQILKRIMKEELYKKYENKRGVVA